MKKERKELMKSFKNLLEDLLDNYEKYTESEKKKIRDLFSNMSELNKILDKYDVEKKVNYFEFLDTCNKYFGSMDY